MCMKRNCMTTSKRIPDRVIDTMYYDRANKLALTGKRIQRLAKRKEEQMQGLAAEKKKRDLRYEECLRRRTDSFEKAYRNYLSRR